MKNKIIGAVRNIQQTILDFLPLVRGLAGKWKGRAAEYDDLVQFGCIRVSELAAKIKDPAALPAYMRKTLSYDIRNEAKRLRGIAECERASEELAECIVDAVSHDWQTRETKMFRELRKLLTQQELELVFLLYADTTQRAAAREIGTSHTAVQKRLTKIREKLTPIKSWLEDMREYPCVDTQIFDCTLTLPMLKNLSEDEETGESKNAEN